MDDLPTPPTSTFGASVQDFHRSYGTDQTDKIRRNDNTRHDMPWYHIARAIRTRGS